MGDLPRIFSSNEQLRRGHSFTVPDRVSQSSEAMAVAGYGLRLTTYGRLSTTPDDEARNLATPQTRREARNAHFHSIHRILVHGSWECVGSPQCKLLLVCLALAFAVLPWRWGTSKSSMTRLTQKFSKNGCRGGVGQASHLRPWSGLIGPWPSSSHSLVPLARHPLSCAWEGQRISIWKWLASWRPSIIFDLCSRCEEHEVLSMASPRCRPLRSCSAFRVIEVSWVDALGSPVCWRLWKLRLLGWLDGGNGLLLIDVELLVVASHVASLAETADGLRGSGQLGLASWPFLILATGLQAWALWAAADEAFQISRDSEELGRASWSRGLLSSMCCSS